MINLNEVELLFGAVDEASAILVDDYPYGRRLRTQIRYWLESKAGHGDRFCSQTLNPKTGAWNKPKRSTYAPVGVIYREPETGYIRWWGLGTWPDKETLASFCGVVGAERLNEIQKASLAEVIARTRVFEHVTFEVREGPPSEAEKAEQAAVERRVWAAVAREAGQAREELG